MRDNLTWGASGVLNADQEMRFFPSTQHWRGHIWTAGSSSHLPSTRKTQNTAGSFSKRPWCSIMGLKHFSYEETLKELRLASWEKTSFRGTFSMHINTWWKTEKTVPSDRPRYNRHKSKNMQFHLNTRKHILTVIMVKQRNRLPGEAVKYPSLEIFKI